MRGPGKDHAGLRAQALGRAGRADRVPGRWRKSPRLGLCAGPAAVAILIFFKLMLLHFQKRD